MPAIMICDDEPVSVQPIVDRLEYEGMDVETTTNPDDCLGRAKKQSFDLYMLDMQFGPNDSDQPRDGLDLAKRLQEQDPTTNTPIIGITGHMPEKREEALSSGLAQFFEKPYNVGDVVQKIIDLTRAQESQSIDEITFGEAVYVLRHPHTVVKRSGFFSIEALAGYIDGQGETSETAREDFERQVHERFQSIRSKRPLFRNDEETRIWSALEHVIDIPEYNSRLIVTVPHEVGHIFDIDEAGRRIIEWYDGEQNEIDLRDSPVELVSLAKGQWFKAVVQRKESTYELIKILHVDPFDKAPIYTQVERARFWNRNTGTE